jgi:hypothetical protein
MSVQVIVLLIVAVVLMRPWRLATWRRCELCRSSTPRRGHRCRFCGARTAESGGQPGRAMADAGAGGGR